MAHEARVTDHPPITRGAQGPRILCVLWASSTILGGNELSMMLVLYLGIQILLQVLGIRTFNGDCWILLNNHGFRRARGTNLANSVCFVVCPWW